MTSSHLKALLGIWTDADHHVAVLEALVELGGSQPAVESLQKTYDLIPPALQADVGAGVLSAMVDGNGTFSDALWVLNTLCSKRGVRRNIPAGRTPHSNRESARAPHHCSLGVAPCYLLYMLTRALLMPSLFHRPTLPTSTLHCNPSAKGMTSRTAFTCCRQWTTQARDSSRLNF